MSNNQGKVYSVFFRIGLPIVFLVIYVIYMSTADSPSGWWMLLAMIVGYYGYYWFKKWARRCPKCYKWDAANKIKTDILDIDSDRDRYFSETTSQEDLYGNLVKTTRNYKEASWTTHYLDHFECEFCQHKWENKRSKSHSVKNEI